MRVGPLLSTAVGLGLAAWLLASYGAGALLELLGRAGWGILVIVAFHAVQVLLSAAGWRAVAKTPIRLGDYVVLRWIREGVNNLLPVAQIGGEVVAARLMRRHGVPFPAAMAGSVADLSIELITQVIFTLLGLGLLAALLGAGEGIAYAAWGAGLLASTALAFIGAQYLGAARWVEHGLLRLAGAMGWTALAEIEGLNARLQALYQPPGSLLRSGLWHLLCWLSGGIEVWLGLRLLGHDVGLVPALVVESLGQALKAAGFAVPGGVGVAETGYVGACHLFGLPAEAGLALALLKRLREVAWGVPALANWRVLTRKGPALRGGTT